MIMPSRLNFFSIYKSSESGGKQVVAQRLSRTAPSDRVDLSAHVEATTRGENEDFMIQGRVEGACESSYP